MTRCGSGECWGEFGIGARGVRRRAGRTAGYRQGGVGVKDSLIAELDNDSLSAALSFRCLAFGKQLQNIVDV